MKRIQIWHVDTPEDKTTIEYKYSEAQKTGVTEKSDTWKKYPERMLYWKCLAKARVEVCPEALDGMPIYEDYQDYEKKVIDLGNVEDEDHPHAELIKKINDSQTVEDLQKLTADITRAKDTSVIKVYANRKKEIETGSTVATTQVIDDTVSNESDTTNNTVEEDAEDVIDADDIDLVPDDDDATDTADKPEQD